MKEISIANKYFSELFRFSHETFFKTFVQMIAKETSPMEMRNSRAFEQSIPRQGLRNQMRHQNTIYVIHL